jgi:TolB protein
MKRSVAFAALLATAFVATPAAHASFPGANGRIAFYDAASRPARVHAIDPNGAGHVQLTSGRRNAVDPAWSADGTRIAFATFVSGPRPKGRIEIADANGQNRRIVVSMGPRMRTADPAWSPGGGRLAFCVKHPRLPDTIFVVRVDGTGLTRLSDEGEDQCEPDWSPDGTQIAFTSRILKGRTLLGVMPSRRPRMPNDRNYLAGRGVNDWPSWSPDGTKIAFARYTRHLGQRELYLVDAATGHLTRVTRTRRSERTPAWSPDGTLIAFVRGPRGATQDIWTIRPNGSGAVRVARTPAVDELGLAWQPA